MLKNSWLLVLWLGCSAVAAQPSVRPPAAELERYAAAAPAQATSSVTELARYLSRPATSDYDKAQLIYAWIGHHIRYEVAVARRIQGGKRVRRRKQQPDVVLRRQLAVCGGYAELFRALADAMGLRAVVIVGDAKGASLGPGHRKIKHAWNAFYAEGRWHLLDVTWGAGGLQKRHQQLVFVPEFDPYWFDVAPSEFVFWHFPNQPRWQGVETPLKARAFRKLPSPDPQLFGYGLAPAELLDAALGAKYRLRLPDTYGGWIPLRLRLVPLAKSLVAGDSCRFEVEAPVGWELMLLNGGETHLFKRAGEVLSITLRPTAGPLWLRARRPDTLWGDILKYVVRPATPARHPRT